MTLRNQGALARTSTRGPSLYFYSCVPEGAPAAVVGVVHGYAEYGARYMRVMDLWAQRGIAAIAIDLRGHGRAGGPRGVCDRFGEYVEDLLELERLVREVPAPAFLFGHSFGGLVSVSSVLARPQPWRALVLSAPFIGLGLEVPRIKRAVGEIASRVVPWLALPNGIQTTDVTHDTELAAAYAKDPLVFHFATARWFTETQAAQARVLANASALSLPLYVAMGTADPIASLPKARAFFDAVASRDKKWDERQGLLHEVLNEPEWRTIAEPMADFILAHV